MLRPLALSALFALTAVSLCQARPHPYDLQHVKWHVVLDEPTQSVKGDIVNRIKPAKGATEVWFDRGELAISAAYVNAAKAKFRIVGQKVYVTLPKKSPATVDVRFIYSGKPRAGLYFVPAKRAFPAKTPSIYTQGEMEDNRFWLVTYDYPDDKATSEGIIEVAKGYFALSNGKLLSTKVVGNRSVYHWKMDQPHATYLIALVAGPYEKGHEAWGSLSVDWYVPKGLKSMGAAAFTGTADMVRVFSELTGFKYPYAKFSQAVVPDYMFGGMENITMVTNTIGALHPKSAQPIVSSEGLVLHELAHQWFGDTVTTNGWSDGWINEGWASFLPAFYVRQKPHTAAWTSEDDFSMSRYDTFNGGLGAHKQKPYRGMVYKDYKDPLDMFDGFLYAGGASRMFMLMNMLGEKPFWAATKQYLNERKYTSFDTPAFFKTWSRVTGRDLTGFMNQWYYRNEAPHLTGNWSGSDVVVSQPLPYFDLQVPVWVLGESGWIKKSVHLTGAEARIAVPEAAGRPFLIDPEVWIMTDITYQNSLSFDDRMALLNALPAAGGKMRVLDQLLSGRTPSEALTVAKSLSQPNLRARYLGQVRAGEGVTEFLLEQAASTDRNLANTALDRIATQTRNAPEAIELARQLWTIEPNDIIRHTAFLSLLTMTNDEALANEGWRKDSFNDQYRQIALNFWNRRDRDRAREMALEAIARNFPEPTRVTAIRMLGSLKDKPGERRAFNALMTVLKEDSFGARNTAISALAEYGDRAAVSSIRPFLTHPLVFFRQTADLAIERLERN
jgi:aminopeptidase N